MDKEEFSQQPRLPKGFLNRLKAVTAKRPKTVIDHILKHGFITTEDLSEKYGYDHPPRAARDVREQGIPLVTFRVNGKHGRKIGAYKFGEPSKVEEGKLGGRKAWPKTLKETLVRGHGPRCAVCHAEYEPRYLQIDHRVPFEVAGDGGEDANPDEFMLVCGSCNRAKSWSCEKCRNWTSDHVPEICQACYWASPQKYDHISLRPIRRLDVVWSGKEVFEYECLLDLSKHARKNLPEFVKDALREAIDDEVK